MKNLFIVSIIVLLFSFNANAQINLVYPSGTIHTLTPLMDWSDVPSAVMYRVQVYAGATSIVNDSTTLSQYQILPGLFNYNISYYWRIGVRNTSGIFVWSSNIIFDITDSTLPSPPVLLYPPDNGIVCTTTPTFDWTDVPGAVSYRIQVSFDQTFNTLELDVSGLVNSGYTPTSGISGGPHYWRVNATNGSVTSSWSTTRKFTVGAIQAPVLLTPPNGSLYVNLHPLFDWNNVPGAISSRFQISLSPIFATLLYDTITNGGLYFPPGFFTNNTYYYWRVAAINSTCGQSNWSTVYSFRTIPLVINLLSSEVPTEYKLYNNFPNPFNPSTTIKFAIPNGFPVRTSGNDNVVLKVFDVSGREVETLVNEQLQPGTYSAQWNASAYSSGVYFYKIQSGDFSETKRMLLIK